MIVLLVVAILCLVAGSLAAVAVHAAPRADPALSATKAIGEEIGRHRSIRRFLDSRLERGVATGLALTLALVATIAAGILIGVLIYMVRSQTGLVQVDRAVERWSDPRMTPLSIATLRTVTAVRRDGHGRRAGVGDRRLRGMALAQSCDPAVPRDRHRRSAAPVGSDQGSRPADAAGSAAAGALHRPVVPERAHHRRCRNLRRDRDRARPRRVDGPQDAPGRRRGGVGGRRRLLTGVPGGALGDRRDRGPGPRVDMGRAWLRSRSVAASCASPHPSRRRSRRSRRGLAARARTGVGPPQREESQ